MEAALSTQAAKRRALGPYGWLRADPCGVCVYGGGGGGLRASVRAFVRACVCSRSRDACALLGCAASVLVYA